MAVVVGIAKLALGAWIVLILVPLLVGMMWAIRTYYLRLTSAVRPETPIEPEQVATRVIMPIARLDVPERQALAFGQAIARDRLEYLRPKDRVAVGLLAHPVLKCTFRHLALAREQPPR